MTLSNLTTDPFTIVAKAILHTLQTWTPWSNIVLPGNVIDMTLPQFQDWLINMTSVDVPRAIMVQGRFSRKPLCSLGSSWMQAYTFFVPFDTLVSLKLNQFKNATYDALMQGDRLFGLGGQSIIRGWQITDAMDDAFGALRFKAGQKRWVHTFTIRVEGYKQY